MDEEVHDLEDVSMFKLTDAERERLFEMKTECILCWTNKKGWPVGMPHLFVWHDQRFWVCMTTRRKRVRALEARPQTCIVVTSAGTSMPGAMVTAKTLATVHYDRERLNWFLPLFLDRSALPPEGEARRQQMELLNTPGRIVVEFEPVEFFTYDSGRLADAVAASGYTGWGSRGPRPG
jgi:hypothetical protein